MNIVMILSTGALCFSFYQMGRIKGRGERTHVDAEWEYRIANGHGPRS